MNKLLLLVIAALTFSCSEKEQKPNVILIMADDMGFECLSANGATDYQTPNLDRLGATGIRFLNAYSQPLCTPSRVKIMTGKHNYRNYEDFGYLNPNQKTIGNLMKAAGYETCISGKWQLNGLNRQNPGMDDIDRPHHFGFDEYCLWQLHKRKSEGERFANPLIYANGQKLEGLEDQYGPDVFSDFICSFIEKNVDKPFFVYYPMVLVHDPFVPTPDSPEWQTPELRDREDNKYFKDMVEYTDKVVAKIEKKLIDLNLDKNTILIFTGDNGTNVNLTTNTVNGPYPGGKGLTTQRGIHVPFIASWPGSPGKLGNNFSGLVDFSDIYTTLADIAGIDISGETIDGQSFYPVLKGNFNEKKESVLIHYDPRWGGRIKNRFAVNDTYKLYQDGKFYNHRNDIDEALPIEQPTDEEKKVMSTFRLMLDQAEAESPWID